MERNAATHRAPDNEFDRHRTRRRLTADPAGAFGDLKVALPLVLACFAGEALHAAEWTLKFPITGLWVPGPLLFCWLLLVPYRRWPSCILAAVAGIGAATALFHGLHFSMLLSIAGDCLLISVCACLMLLLRGTQVPTESFWEIGRFILLACMLMPMARGWWLGSFPCCDHLRPFAVDFWPVTLTTSVSFLILVPTIVSTAEILKNPERRQGWRWSNLLTGLLLFFMLWLVWDHPWHVSIIGPLLVLAPIPLLIWSLIVFGTFGACISLLIVSTLGLLMGVFGSGPFFSLSLQHTLMTSQMCTFGTGVALLFLAALAEQNVSKHLMLQKAYRQLSELTGRMLVVQEEERTRIARDLHDDINQSIAAISIRLSSLKRDINIHERASINEIQEQLLSVSNDIRDISHELHPSILRFTGLTSALKAFCGKHNSKGKLQLHCGIIAIDTLSNEQELGLFRIVQEAVNNVDKHARATIVEIALSIEGSEIVLTVDDDGIGYTPATGVRPLPGLGMISMEERARVLGGSLHVRRRPAGGTRVEVRFPASTTSAPSAA